MSRNLLKEAIADAKAVKETAIANAKAYLEEAFTPQLRTMLATKLEEMDEDEYSDDNRPPIKDESYPEQETERMRNPRNPMMRENGLKASNWYIIQNNIMVNILRYYNSKSSKVTAHVIFPDVTTGTTDCQ